MNAIESYPETKDKLSKAKKCALCSKPFLSEWLECVQFVPPSKVKSALCANMMSRRAPIFVLPNEIWTNLDFFDSIYDKQIQITVL